MTNYNNKFKKNLIADWIGRDLSAALRRGVKTNLSPKAFIAASVFASSLALSPIAYAEIENNGQPIVVGEYLYNENITENISKPDEEFEIKSSNDDSFRAGISVDYESSLTIDPIKSLDITYTDDSDFQPSSSRSVSGINVSKNSNANIVVASDIDINVKTKANIIYGITNSEGEDYPPSMLSLKSNEGSININVSNVEDSPGTNIYGLRNTNGGQLDLNAKKNITVSSSISVNGKYNELGALKNDGDSSNIRLSAEGYITLESIGNETTAGIFNTHGNSDLDTGVSLTSQGANEFGYGIDIRAYGDGQNTYGVSNMNRSLNLISNNGGIHISAEGNNKQQTTAITSSGGKVLLKSNKNILLEATGNSDGSTLAALVSGGTEGNFKFVAPTIELSAKSEDFAAYGIQALNTFVDFTGDTLKVSASSNTASKGFALLAASADITATINGLTSIYSSGTGLYSWKNYAAEPTISITSSSNLVQVGSIGVRSDGENASVNLIATGEKTVVDEDTQTNLTGTNVIDAKSTGLMTQNSGTISLTANQNNSIIATTALWADSGVISLKADNANHIDATNYGLFIDKSGYGLLDVTNGVNRIAAGTLSETEGVTSGSGLAIYTNSNGQAEINSPLGNNEILGYIQVQNGQNSKATLTAGNNFISSNTNTVQVYTNGIVSVQANKTDQENSGNNFVYSKYANGYGQGLAVQALSQGSVYITAQETNSIFGAISSKNEGSSVSVDGKTNFVKSFAVISNAGNLNNATDDKFKDNRVISALYAEGKGAQISLTGEQNYLSTLADSSVHTDLERVVWAYDGADINIAGFTSITTDSYEKSLNSIDIAIAAGTAVNLTEDIVNEDVTDRAQVQIDYANTTDSEGKAVLSSVTGDILSAYAGTVNIAPKSASDGLVVTGNLLAGNNGELTVDIGTNGVLTGRSDDYGDAGFITDSEHTTFFDPAFSSAIYKGGQVKLKMGDNARWNVTGQSWITDISVADGAKNVLIDLVNANTDRNSTAHALTVYNLKGNATFNMSLDGNRDVSDMLYIRNANGEYNVNVVDAVTVDDMYKGGLNGLRFATVGAGSKAKFRAFTYDKGALNVEYEVATDSYDNNPENDIYNGTEMSHEKPGSTVVDGLFGYEEGAVATLALNDEASTKTADGTINETTNFKLVDRKDATPSDSGKTIIDHARANYANAVQLDTLNKRQGEMRFSQGYEDGLWARIRHDDIGKRSSFRLDNTMVEVGVDSRYVKETGEFHTGVAFDYMNGDTDYHHISGEGDLDRYGVWFYTTWLGNEGDYTDFIIKCSLIDNEYKIYAPTTGEKITGDYDNNVISVSLEHGKKYSNEESWFIEPQAQLQYAYVTSAEYTNSQGTDVRLDGIHSLIGRVGVRAGKDVTRDNPFTFYARGDIMHEFMGKQDIKAKDATGTMRVRYENDDTWYSAGLGMSYQHNKDKYYFLEAEKVFGGSNTSSYIVSGGVRFLFD